MKHMKRMLLALLLVLMTVLTPSALAKTITVDAADYLVEEDGWYDSMEEVAVYLTFFEELPENYLTKKEAQNLGWESKKGNLWDVAYGCSIGGDRFGNYEGILPDAKGRKWTECDIDFDGSYRGSERIVFSNDGLIYYTGNHYKSFDRIDVVWSDEDDSDKKNDDTKKQITKKQDTKNSGKKSSEKKNSSGKNTNEKNSNKKNADQGGYAYKDQSADDDFGSFFSDEELDSIVNWLFGE